MLIITHSIGKINIPHKKMPVFGGSNVAVFTIICSYIAHFLITNNGMIDREKRNIQAIITFSTIQLQYEA